MLKSEERPRPHSLGRSALCAESFDEDPHDSPATGSTDSVRLERFTVRADGNPKQPTYPLHGRISQSPATSHQTADDDPRCACWLWRRWWRPGAAAPRIGVRDCVAIR